MELNTLWYCSPGEGVEGLWQEEITRKGGLAGEKALGTQVLCCGFAAMAKDSGCVLLAFICVKGGEKKIPDLVIQKKFQTKC